LGDIFLYNRYNMAILEKPTRNFLPNDLIIDEWKKLEKYFEDLKSREIKSKADLEKWLKDLSELEAVVEEDEAWRYIKMSINTADENLRNSYSFFVTEIQPQIAPYSHQFDLKLVNSPFLKELDFSVFEIPIKRAQKNIEVFREKNIPLISKLQTKAQEFGAINGKMEVEVNGEVVTMPKAGSLLKDTNREFRKEVFEKIGNERLKHASNLDDLFDDLIQKRHELANNAGFANYRDYMFAAMQRFDYTPQDCFKFHDAVETQLVPVLNQLAQERKSKLGLENLKPYDLAVDPNQLPPLKPFDGAEQLVSKTIESFGKLDVYFADSISTMQKLGHLDLESKKGKAPGGYNYPLYEIGVPFIFMNAVGTVRDLVTMVHEGGHAIHSFLSRDLELTSFKSLTSEIAELASMSMELLSMEHWDSFFENENDLKRAKKEHLEDVLSTLPWIALIDKFQHWIYENPNHTREERHAKWLEYHKRFSANCIEWSEYEDFRKTMWQKQLHLFEVPFYYIEYGIAQLGAIAVFRNYKSNKQKAIEQYKQALASGYTQSIGKVFETAGVKFDFSENYIKELATFIQKELNSI